MKTLKKIQLKSVPEVLSDKEMKLVVGGYDLPPVTVWGYGPDNCKKYGVDWELPTVCDYAMAYWGKKCRTADCTAQGQCKFIPISMVPKCATGLW